MLNKNALIFTKWGETMKVIYTRTMRVKDDGLGKAMEIGKG